MTKLILSPNEILSKELDPVDLSRNDIPNLAYTIKSMMYYHNGLGLSANQIGENSQIFAMRTILNKNWGNDIVVINPVLLAVSKETSVEPEGCLSHPGLILKVKRPISCAAEFYTFIDNYSKLTKVQAVFEDIDARIFLHEFDHLSGIEFVDRVTRPKLQLALKRKLKKEKR
jgi:peptide deformylase